MKITWLGHASFRIEIGGQVLLLDPWLTGNPMFPGARRAEAIAGATHILNTHGHGDHAGNAVEIAAETLRANRIAERAGSSELAVYGRQGQPCTRCGDLVKVTHHGEAHRVLYWCPGCQIAHEPMLRPNFTPLGVARPDEFGDTHPAARQFMSEIAATRRAAGR